MDGIIATAADRRTVVLNEIVAAAANEGVSSPARNVITQSTADRGGVILNTIAAVCCSVITSAADKVARAAGGVAVAAANDRVS